jgi:hypothetical protein
LVATERQLVQIARLVKVLDAFAVRVRIDGHSTIVEAVGSCESTEYR